MEWSIDVVGWYGALIALLAYAPVLAQQVEGDSVLFQVLNISGAALPFANTFYRGAYPSAFVAMPALIQALYVRMDAAMARANAARVLGQSRYT